MLEEEKIASVPYYIHEAVCDKMERATKAALESNRIALEKMDRSNKRILTALIVVCLTLLITVCCFLVAYKDMNNTWLDFFENHAEEVQNGIVFDERNQGVDSKPFEG